MTEALPEITEQLLSLNAENKKINLSTKNDRISPEVSNEMNQSLNDTKAELSTLHSKPSNPSETEDSQSENEEELPENEWFSADHPLLSRMQIALKKRLNRQLNRLNIAILENEQDLHTLNEERENIGVELYHRQKELVSDQIKLETVETQNNNIRIERIESENGLDELRKQYSELKIHKKVQNKKFMDARQELDSLNESLRHIIEYQSDMKKEILNQRRSAYASEEIMQELESNKIKQDLLINHLETKINSFRSQIEIYEIQRTVQEQETLSAKEILRESLNEMQMIKNEKREYLLKWKSSVIEINKRNEILCKIRQSLSDLDESIRLKNIEMIQYEKDIRNEQSHIDTQQIIITKISADKESIDTKLNENLKMQTDLMTKLSNLKMNLNRNEIDLKSHKIDAKKYNDNIAVLEKKYVKIINSIHEIDAKIENNYSENITLQHGTENSVNEIKKIRKIINEKEFYLENLKNDIAKLKYNQVTFQQIIADLNDKFHETVQKLSHNTAIICEYEKEFKRGTDELGKKTNVLDRCNNKLEKLTAAHKSSEDGAVSLASPLEHTIHALYKQLKHSKSESEQLQKQWIIKQTELVNLVNESMQSEEIVADLLCRDTILNQKKIRLQNECAFVTNDIREIEKNIDRLRLDIVKINKYIDKYNGEYNNLTREYERIEDKCKCDLEIGEEQINDLKHRICKINENKSEFIRKITESEKHILLWERKIGLEIETQKALDPNFGKAEVEDMKREIHKMEHRLNQIKRKQDCIIKEMELSINKKEMIQIKHFKNNSAENNKQKLNKKQIRNIKLTLKNNLKQKKEIMAEIEHFTQKYNVLLQNLHGLSGTFNELNQAKQSFKEQILHKNVLHKVHLSQIVLKQKLCKDISKVSEMKASNNINEKYEKQLARITQMTDKIKSLSEQYPQYQSLFDSIIK